MASKVAICNMALQRVGAKRIVSIDDGTEEANACAAIYDIVVEEVISSVAWSSATKRVALARTTTTPVFGFTYEYQLPVDPKCLRVLEIDTDRQDPVEYRIEGDKLVCDETTVNIKYLAAISSAADLGPYITKCVISRLAWELSYSFTGVASLSQTLEARYERDLEMQSAADAIQGTADLLPIGSYILGR